MSHHNTFEKKGIEAPGFQARVGKLFSMYNSADGTEGLSVGAVLTFLFDDVPLPSPERSGDGGRVDSGVTVNVSGEDVVIDMTNPANWGDVTDVPSEEGEEE